MSKTTIQIAAVFGVMSVAIGAFGAHGLKDLLIANGRLETFETAVTYQFYHTLALLGIGVLMTKYEHKLLKSAVIAMVIGIIIFSGSLYLLCFTGVAFLGAITPIGGLAFIIGWAMLFLGIKKAG